MPKPKYGKPILTLEQQADKMLGRGLQGITKEELIQHLRVINYYRIRGYTYPYQNNKQDDEPFKNNITWQMIWNDYCFDKKLRSVIFEAIGTIEIALRTQMEYEMSSEQNSAAWYELKYLFHSETNWEADKKELYSNWKKSKEVFKKHYINKYDESVPPPSWMIFETTTFGNLSKFYQNIANNVKAKFAISNFFGFSKAATPIFESWLQHLTYIRNICAHHGRLYSREQIIRPKIPKHWEKLIGNANRIYISICIISSLLKHIYPKSDFNKKILQLIKILRKQQYPTIGLPNQWKPQYLKAMTTMPI
ncbi:MAG: Abi family protein [Spirochaetales bacterium]|nr:Abi family protein [Spirochaetales bacterium]